MRSDKPCQQCVIVALALLILLSGADSRAQSAHSTQTDPRAALTEIARLGARKPFLVDSPDVYLEPKSLNRFFTDPIYRKLLGNAYFGYDYDEGFQLEGQAIQIDTLKDLTAGQACRAAYRVALAQSLSAAGLEAKDQAPCQIGLCIVGASRARPPRRSPGSWSRLT